MLSWILILFDMFSNHNVTLAVGNCAWITDCRFGNIPEGSFILLIKEFIIVHEDISPPNNSTQFTLTFSRTVWNEKVVSQQPEILCVYTLIWLSLGDFVSLLSFSSANPNSLLRVRRHMSAEHLDDDEWNEMKNRGDRSETWKNLEKN